ncbi:3-methyl-2-oxobutanoate hydroxymethyltransferase, partial [Francisella tularensis]|uniref:3-methyl-2-oxobutanoate hydroxymethyltransferase n=1 Tax=Francisella tularensis TaxID=263 RepID=UPI002381B644
EQAGCFGIVIECIPANIAKYITQNLDIPTIGMGAGSNTDGQILVLQDMRGMNTDFQPKFVKNYIDGSTLLSDAINTYVSV